MKKIIAILIISMGIYGCEEHLATQEEIKYFFDQTEYDSTISQVLPACDSIKYIILKNIDTIFKFRNARNLVHYYNADEKKETIIQQSETRYSFATFNENVSESDTTRAFPDFIGQILDDNLRKLYRKNINYFELWNDGSIMFYLKHTYNTRINIEAIHRLLWQKDYGHSMDPNTFAKDSVFGTGWKYQIWVEPILGR